MELSLRESFVTVQSFTYRPVAGESFGTRKEIMQAVHQSVVNHPLDRLGLRYQVPMTTRSESSGSARCTRETQDFAKTILGQQVDLSKDFEIPAQLPFTKPLLIFDPGLPTRTIIDMALKKQGMSIYSKYLPYKWPETLTPPVKSLVCIEDSLTPEPETRGKASLYRGVQSVGCLDLRGYLLACAMKFYASGQHLDELTWTVFPSTTMSDGVLVYGSWHPPAGRIGLASGYPELFTLHSYGVRKMQRIKEITS